MADSVDEARRAHLEMLEEHEDMATELYEKMASKGGIYMPDRPKLAESNEFWKRRADGRLVLTTQGLRAIDTALEERAESRLDRARNWVAILSPPLSLLFAIVVAFKPSAPPNVYVVVPPNPPYLSPTFNWIPTPSPQSTQPRAVATQTPYEASPLD